MPPTALPRDFGIAVMELGAEPHRRDFPPLDLEYVTNRGKHHDLAVFVFRLRGEHFSLNSFFSYFADGG